MAEMQRVGRKAEPREVLRLRGSQDAPPEKQVSKMASAASGPPRAPDNLGKDGKALWKSAWQRAVVWLSPASDYQAVEHACRVMDAYMAAHNRYLETMEYHDGTLLVNLSRQLGDALGDIGFNPLARGKLGVAEVTQRSKLEDLARKNQAS